jgi:hypothetical protein
MGKYFVYGTKGKMYLYAKNYLEAYSMAKRLCHAKGMELIQVREVAWTVRA